MNLTERAETRRETFYKLTNSAEAPEVPSNGKRNLWIQSKAIGAFGGFVEETLPDNHITGQKVCYRIDSGAEMRFIIEPNFSSRLYRKVTFSAWIKYDNVVQGTNNWNRFNVFKHNFTYHNSETNTNSDIDYTALATYDGTADWQYVHFTVNYSARTGYDQLKGSLIFNLERTKSGTAWVTGVKVEYGDTVTPYSAAPEDSGWSTTTLVPTQQQRYLWKFEYIYYSDGSVEITQPVNLSIAGADGADGTNGQTSHVHFAFADNATGGGFSLTTPKAYMGWYADFNETASNDPTKYKWGKWKGDQGAPGGKGDDGKTSYLHLAYASSANGKTGFSFTDTKQQYQGYYTDFVQTSSTDPTKYTWIDRQAHVKVSGINLLRKTKKFDWSNFYGSSKLTGDTYQGCGVRYLKSNTATSGYQEVVQFSKCVYPTLGGEYIVSFWAKGSGVFTAYFYGDGKYLQIASIESSQGNSGTAPDGRMDFTLTEDWQRYWIKYKLRTAPSSATAVAKHVLFRHVANGKEEEIWLAGCKLEEATIPTPYTESPEDVQADIDSKADQALTQQQLNALAEQNSIVKAEMEAKASIDTVNQWITAYQNYVAANDEARAESEKNLQEAAARILQLKTDVGALRQQWDFIDTYMTVQNEGLIIGKSDGSAYAKFANDRISLFSGSSEVMYISQGVLRIENGIFTKTIQIGRFRFETHPADQDMLVLRYLGG